MSRDYNWDQDVVQVLGSKKRYFNWEALAIILGTVAFWSVAAYTVYHHFHQHGVILV